MLPYDVRFPNKLFSGSRDPSGWWGYQEEMRRAQMIQLPAELIDKYNAWLNK